MKHHRSGQPEGFVFFYLDEPDEELSDPEEALLARAEAESADPELALSEETDCETAEDEEGVVLLD